MPCRTNRLVFSLALFVLPVLANATTLRVDVRTPDGDRAGAGVEVTVTEDGVLTDSPPAATTDRKSRVVFDNIREGRAIVVATRDGARGEWRGEIRGKNRNIKITLEYGLVGVPAIAPSEEEAGQQMSSPVGEEEMGVAMPDPVEPTPTAPQVAMQINQDAECSARDQVFLSTNVSGPSPSHYRASENSSFSGATWETYQPNPDFTLSTGGGIKRVYYQVRSMVDGGYLESNIANDSIERVVSNARATLSINGGADTTFSRSVTLNNEVIFEGGGVNPKYIASELEKFGDAQLQSYTTAPQFTLSQGVGSKTVYFMATREVCGTVVGTETASDTITLGEAVVSDVAIGTAPAPVETEPTPVPTKPFYFQPGDLKSSNWRPQTVATVGAFAKAAQQNGFSHSARKIAGEGTCEVVFDEGNLEEKPALFMVATPAVEETNNVLVKSLICEFTMFAGRKLNPGWGIETFGIPDDLRHPMGEAGKWVGNSSLVSHENLLNHVVRINIPGYQCGIGSPDLFCPICGFKPTGFSCWSLGAYYPNFDLLGPESATDWRDAVKQ